MAEELSDLEGVDPAWAKLVEESLGHTIWAQDAPPTDEPGPDDTEEEDDEEVEEDEPGPDDTEEVEEDDEDDGEPEVDAPSAFELAPGVTLDRDTALTLYQFDQILRQRPDLQAQITSALGAPQPAPPQAPGQPSPVPVVPEPPSFTDDDLLDPTLKALYDYNRALAAQVQTLNDNFARTQSTIQQQHIAEFVTQANTVKAEFATRHSLTPDQVEAIAKKADELGVTRTISMAPDRAVAINESLELAYWSMPEHREAALADQVKSRATRAKKRQRLAGVGSGGGGQTRTDTSRDPRSMNESERRHAMALDVAEQTGYSTFGDE